MWDKGTELGRKYGEVNERRSLGRKGEGWWGTGRVCRECVWVGMAWAREWVEVEGVYTALEAFYVLAA